MNARVYDPDIGRFLSPDPTVPNGHNPQSFNRYAYALNSPLNLVDLDGFEPRDGPHGYSDGSKDQPRSTSSRAETADNLGQGRASGGAEPKNPKNASGNGLKGNFSDLFPQYEEDPGPAPIVTMGQNFGALAAWGVGKITGDTALANAAMEGMQEARPANVNVLGLMLSFGRAPRLGGVPRTDSIKEGSFSIVDWKGYPTGIPKPDGPFRLVKGSEYDVARKAADNANNAIRREQGLAGKPVDIHEVKPVKFGGSPTDASNKIVVPRDVHRQEVTPWWNRLQKDITKP
jgi:hypothetical protein